MGYVTKWIRDVDQALKDLRSEGLSFEQVRAELNRKFGTNYSRNACIGRAKRLGLTQSPHEKAMTLASAAVRWEDVKRIRRENAEPRPRRRRYSVAALAAPNVKASDMPVGSIASRPLHAIRKAARQRGAVQEPDMRPLRCVEIEPRHLTIMDLTDETCRWPYGGFPDNTPITFCGHWCGKDQPYCDAHQALAGGYGTPSERMAHQVARKDAA